MKSGVSRKRHAVFFCLPVVLFHVKYIIMATIKLRLNRGRVLRDGTYPLVFQIIHSRRKRVIYTGFRLSMEEFDFAEAKVLCFPGSRHTEQEVKQMNRYLCRERRVLERIVKVLEQRKGEYGAGDVVARYRLCRDGQQLLRCFDLQVERKLTEGKLGTASAWRSTCSSLASFVTAHSVRLQDVDAAFVRRYEDFLVCRGMSRNTVGYYLRNFRAMYNQAKKAGYFVGKGNPFEGVSARPCRTTKRALPEEFLQRIQATDFSAFPHLDLARDLFLFSFFSRGMPFVDLVYLKKENLAGGVICYRRRKTGQELRVTLTARLERLIAKYANPSEYVFPLLSGKNEVELRHAYRLALERVNCNLKTVAKSCGIELPLTTYVARHSWATRAKELGVPLAVISEGLGHTSERTTRIYLKEFDHSVVDEVNERVSAL